MKLTQILMVVVLILVVSLVANALLINERLEKKFYQKGVTDGSKNVVTKIIEQVQKTGRLNVSMPDGSQATLAVQKPIPMPTFTPTDPNNGK